MKRAIILLIVAALVMVGCAGKKPKCEDCIDPNYGAQLKAMENMVDKQIQLTTSLANICAGDSNPGLCVSALSRDMSSAVARSGKIPEHRQQRTFGQEMALSLLNLGGKALPILGQYKINESNNEARVAIQRSNNDMLSGIVSDGYSSVTAIGSVPTTSITVGNDYIVGDGNVSGDGSVVGDGNGDGDRWGDGNVVGDGIVVGDGNGDGSRFGDNGTMIDGDGSFVGDNNGDRNGDNRDNNGPIDNSSGNDNSDNGDDDDDPPPSP